MKKIFKFLWFYCEISFFFLNTEEAILRFCASDKRFSKDDFRPYKHYFTVFSADGHVLIGSLVCQFGEWALTCNALTGDITGVKSLRQLKKLLKKYDKI
jgi:hypothetical protein